ncbi:MAG: PepSY domain-containing protein [Capnocytophaga sp.]|nr:PepSY domain-containing protein [Capnocytophaga sp.]
MILSVWRYAHLAFAIVASIFILIASLTGIILSYHSVNKQTYPFKVSDFEEITLAQTIDGLKNAYSEISVINVDYRGFVNVEAEDQNGEKVEGYIHPITGEILGEIRKSNAFIKWTVTLHRSLFLHSTGRIIMGVVSFLLFLISISGIILIVQKQSGGKNFFKKVVKDDFSKYYHTILGRWLLIPIVVLSLTGAYLVTNRFILKEKAEKIVHNPDFDAEIDYETPKNIKEIPYFNNTLLKNVSKIEFPFADDIEDTFLVKTRDKELIISQFSGNILSEKNIPATQVWAFIGLNLHTGRTNIAWAVILGISCIGILVFIYTGFAITLKRKSTKIINKYKPSEAEFIILFGSESSSTLHFAMQVHKQLLHLGKKSFLTDLNNYNIFQQSTHLLIFTSTYGIGDAPNNADKFLSILEKYSQKNVKYNIVGFGSSLYPDYCKFAKDIENELVKKEWATPLLPLHTVDKASLVEFTNWVKQWNEKTQIILEETPNYYELGKSKLHTFKVLKKTAVSDKNDVFTMLIKSSKSFTCGDLLAIFPDGKQERLYSIGKVGGNIHLTIKLHPNGLGSGYLYNLKEGEKFKASIRKNESFYFPKKAKRVILIANGTGIAPFLGMIEQNKASEIYLYAGFRCKNEIIDQYIAIFEQQKQKNKLKEYQFAFSREESKEYVTDLVQKQAHFIKETLENDGVIMICGSLAMYNDISLWLDTLSSYKSAYYKASGQLLVDCY